MYYYRQANTQFEVLAWLILSEVKKKGKYCYKNVHEEPEEKWRYVLLIP
jgi:hypothetical protein